MAPPGTIQAAGMGAKAGVASAAGSADLPATDFAEGLGEGVLDVDDFVWRGGLEFRRQVGKGLIGAAGVEEEIGGFEELRFTRAGHRWHLELLKGLMQGRYPPPVIFDKLFRMFRMGAVLRELKYSKQKVYG